jgi:histidinol dehydrogenase
LLEDADHIRRLATLEGLTAHAASVTERLQGKGQERK